MESDVIDFQSKLDTVQDLCDQVVLPTLFSPEIWKVLYDVWVPSSVLKKRITFKPEAKEKITDDLIAKMREEVPIILNPPLRTWE